MLSQINFVKSAANEHCELIRKSYETRIKFHFAEYTADMPKKLSFSVAMQATLLAMQIDQAIPSQPVLISRSKPATSSRILASFVRLASISRRLM